MNSSIITITSTASLVLASLTQAPMALGQEQTGASPDSPEAVCMTRPFNDVLQVPAERRGQKFRILTTERSAATLEAKGFERVECGTADLVLADKRNSWRDEICELASFGNEAVQNQFERAYGERPAVLCAHAEQVAGRWERPRKRENPSMG